MTNGVKLTLNVTIEVIIVLIVVVQLLPTLDGRPNHTFCQRMTNGVKLTPNVTIVVVLLSIVVLLLPTLGGRLNQHFLVKNDKWCETYTKCNNRSDNSTHSSSTITAYSRWQAKPHFLSKNDKWC